MKERRKHRSESYQYLYHEIQVDPYKSKPYNNATKETNVHKSELWQDLNELLLENIKYIMKHQGSERSKQIYATLLQGHTQHETAKIIFGEKSSQGSIAGLLFSRMNYQTKYYQVGFNERLIKLIKSSDSIKAILKEMDKLENE